MFIEYGRDIGAMFALDKLLSQVREEYMELALSGQTPDNSFWEKREAAVFDTIRKEFFDIEKRKSSGPDEPEYGQTNKTFSGSGTTSKMGGDEKVPSLHLNGHSQHLLEHAIRMTHEITKHIPYVGQK